MSLYHLGNARLPEQRENMIRLEQAGICVFCPQHLEGEDGQRVVHRTEHWLVTPNAFPYRSTSLHLLLVPRLHVRELLELPDDARHDLWTALGWVKSRHRLTSYALGSRNGDPSGTGGTVEHLHVHVLVADPVASATHPLKMRFSSATPEETARFGRAVPPSAPEPAPAPGLGSSAT